MEGAAITANMFSSVIEQFTGVITPELILSVIGTILATGMVFVFTWWGARKVVRALTKSFLKGKLSI